MGLYIVWGRSKYRMLNLEKPTYTNFVLYKSPFFFVTELILHKYILRLTIKKSSLTLQRSRKYSPFFVQNVDLGSLVQAMTRSTFHKEMVTSVEYGSKKI